MTMSTVTYDQVIHLAKQLGDNDRRRLIAELQRTFPPNDRPLLTRDMILEEHRRLVEAGAFENVPDLAGKYARPDLDLSLEELEAGISEFANQWKEDFDGLSDED